MFYLGTKGSIAGIIQGQGVAVGPICIGAQGPSGRKSFENVSEETKHDFRDSSRSHDYPRSTTNDNYVDENYLLQGGSTTRHTTKKVQKLFRPFSSPFQRRNTERNPTKIAMNHNFSQSSNDRSFSKSVKKIYSIFNVHESPDTARRLGKFLQLMTK